MQSLNPNVASTEPASAAHRIDATCFDLRHHDDDTCEWQVAFEIVGLGTLVTGDLTTQFHDHPEVTILFHRHPLLGPEQAKHLLTTAFEVVRDHHLSSDFGINDAMSLIFDADPWLRHHLDEETAEALVEAMG